MSHKDLDELSRLRLTYDGPERFSDRCVGCKHPRAEHLARGITMPIAGGYCRRMTLRPTPENRTNREECRCDWREHNV